MCIVQNAPHTSFAALQQSCEVRLFLTLDTGFVCVPHGYIGTYHVIGIPLVTSGFLTFSGAVISQTANAARNTLSLKRRNGATVNAYSKPM